MNRSAVFVACLAGVALVPALGGAVQVRHAQAPIVEAAAATIEAPSTVDPGAHVNVVIAGAAPGGRLEIWGPVTQGGRGSMLAGGEVRGTSVPITAPRVPGSYELRYMSASGAMLARRSLDVAAVPIVLSVPERFSAGVPGTVRWQGPAGRGDRLQIVDPSSGNVVSQVEVKGKPFGWNSTVIHAPAQPGKYLLRYVDGRGAVLRALSVMVGPSSSWMGLPMRVPPGQTFKAMWYGTLEPGQAFEVVDPKTGAVLASAAPSAGGDTRSAMLRAPDRRGTYRVRFLNTRTGRVYSDRPLEVR